MNILITGGSSGLGEAITRKLAQDQSCMVYFTFNQSETKARAIENEFSNTSGIKCDFKNTTEVDLLCKKIQNLELDILINNAYHGIFIDTHFHKTPITSFASGFEENILPTILITQAAINAFRKKKFGKIITVLSAAITELPPTGTSVYIANKSYLHALTKIWAVENAKFNITSNVVSPSFMLTNFTKDIDERIVEQIKEGRPGKQLLTTQEVAESIFLLTKASNEINGVNTVINDL